jgi:hypothetical protein
MSPEEITAFVKANVESLPARAPYGPRYRVAALLTDGTQLPCVVVEAAGPIVDLAMRRFEEEKKGGIRAILKQSGGYRAIVRSFVTSRNSVVHYDIASLQLSRFSISLERSREIGGETSMGWTEFYGTMRDGREFRFGTTFFTEFFDMPEGYSASDIVKIEAAVRSEKPRHERVYREKPFFTCYIDGV